MDQQSRLRSLTLKWKPISRSVLQLNLKSALDGSALNWYEQYVLRELMSEDLLFAKMSEPEMMVVNFDDHFCDRMGEVDRGHTEVFLKLWNQGPMTRQMARSQEFLDSLRHTTR